jgi:hypothetical protein
MLALRAYWRMATGPEEKNCPRVMGWPFTVPRFSFPVPPLPPWLLLHPYPPTKRGTGDEKRKTVCIHGPDYALRLRFCAYTGRCISLPQAGPLRHGSRWGPLLLSHKKICPNLLTFT